MKPILLALTLAALSVVLSPAADVLAQEEKVARGTIAEIGGSIKTATAMRSIGTVKAVGADSITISGNSGGGGKFTQTFTIGPDTRVVGKGAGTASAANGGKAPVNRLVSVGDRVSVSYNKTGTALHASGVRVTVKGSGSD